MEFGESLPHSSGMEMSNKRQNPAQKAIIRDSLPAGLGKATVNSANTVLESCTSPSENPALPRTRHLSL